MCRLDADPRQRLDDRVGDGVNLTRICSRADNEVIGKTRGVPQIEDCDVLGLFVFRRSNRELDLLWKSSVSFPALLTPIVRRVEGRGLPASLTLGHATCLPPFDVPRRFRGGRAPATCIARAARCVAARLLGRVPQSTLFVRIVRGYS